MHQTGLKKLPRYKFSSIILDQIFFPLFKTQTEGDDQRERNGERDDDRLANAHDGKYTCTQLRKSAHKVIMTSWQMHTSYACPRPCTENTLENWCMDTLAYPLISLGSWLPGEYWPVFHKEYTQKCGTEFSILSPQLLNKRQLQSAPSYSAVWHNFHLLSGYCWRKMSTSLSNWLNCFRERKRERENRKRKSFILRAIFF